MNNDKSVEAEQIEEGRSRETGIPLIFETSWPEEIEWSNDQGLVTFEQVAQEIYDECFDLLVQRQRRYGPTNIDQQGPWGVLSRIANDKLARIKRAFNGQVVHGEIVLDPITDTDTDESYEDALKDLVNYGIILLLLHRKKWGKPLEEEVTTSYE